MISRRKWPPYPLKYVFKDETCPRARGGGGGTQIWFRRGCAAEAAKPVPIFKGHFGGKGYPLLRVFSQENDVLCTLATKWAKISSIYSKITKVGGMFKDFQLKTKTMFKDFSQKSDLLERQTPVCLYTASTPPPPPPRGTHPRFW